MAFKNNLFINNYNIHKNIILKFILFVFIINNIKAKVKTPDNNPFIVSQNVMKLIHSSFHINEVIYKENLMEYTIWMKFLNIRVYDQGIYPQTYQEREFFSISEPTIELILNINITNNNDYINSPNNKSDIIFNSAYDYPNLDFQLKYMNAKIFTLYIDFVRKEDGTYQYVFFYDDYSQNYVDIFFDIDKYKYFPKIYKFLNENEEKIEDLIFNSFCEYLDDILSEYPESDVSYLYKNLVENIKSVQTFALNITSNTKLEKVIINYFQEEDAIMDSALYITNIEIDIDLVFDGETKIENYKGIIHELFITTNFFTFGEDDYSIANTTVNTIIGNVFNLIVDNYIKE